MIAPAKPRSRYNHKAVNQMFEQMLPRIRLMALRAFRDRNRELRYELVAEVLARLMQHSYGLQARPAHIGYATPLACTDQAGEERPPQHETKYPELGAK
jgi:hypothetical protein